MKWRHVRCSSFHEIFYLDFLKIYMASWRLMIFWGLWLVELLYWYYIGTLSTFQDVFTWAMLWEVGSALHLISLVVIILTDFLLLSSVSVAPWTISGLVQCQVGVILAWYLKVLTSTPVIATNIKNEKWNWW